MKIIGLLIMLLASSGPLQFDKLVHDFGTLSTKDGPQTCTFTITNKSDKPITIFAVVSSCGCTEAVWTPDSIEPEKSGTVTATYSNDDGPYPFDKTLTVYTSANKKPYVLHMKGLVKKDDTK